MIWRMKREAGGVMKLMNNFMIENLNSLVPSGVTTRTASVPQGATFFAKNNAKVIHQLITKIF